MKNIVKWCCLRIAEGIMAQITKYTASVILESRKLEIYFVSPILVLSDEVRRNVHYTVKPEKMKRTQTLSFEEWPEE